MPKVQYHRNEDQPVLEGQNSEDESASVKSQGDGERGQDYHDDPGGDDVGGLRMGRILQQQHAGRRQPPSCR